MRCRVLPVLCSLGLGLGSLNLPLSARAADDGHGGSDTGVQVETLVRSNRAWNGSLLPAYPSGQPLVSVLRITIPAGVALAPHHHPVINAGVLLQGRLQVVSASGESRNLQAGDGLIELVNQVHHGTSLGPEPAVILVVYAGTADLPTTVRDGQGSTMPSAGL